MEIIDMEYYRVRADVDLDAIRNNILEIKKGLPDGTKVCAVIKADGYGHGAIPIAKYVRKDVDFFAVATLDEAENLRLHDVKEPILVIGYIFPDNAIAAARSDISITVFDLDIAKELNEIAARFEKTFKIHIKVDTGMSRLGFQPVEENVSVIKEISELPNIEIEGIFTHFFASDSDDLTSAKEQYAKFKGFCDRLEEEGVHIPIRHCCNSAAATVMPEAALDMVRLGISMYGLYPSEFVDQVKLQPALSLKSHIAMVKTVPAGTTVGYGATWKAERDSVIATVTVGYADGYMRRLSNIGYVLINGHKAPIAGRVCMDMFMVDATDVPDVKYGDEVVLIGKSGDEVITMEEIANLAGSFNYEFACDIGKRVPRVYYAGGEIKAKKDYFYDRYEGMRAVLNMLP